MTRSGRANYFSKCSVTFGNSSPYFRWFRQHPRVLSLPWRANVRRSEKANVVDAIVADVRLCAFNEEETNGREMIAQRHNGVESSALNGTTAMDQRQWDNFFSQSVPPFTAKERREWLASMEGVCVASESPFNSRENIDLARQFGAKFVVTPRGGPNDEEICVACEERAIILIHTANTQTMR
ncbi:hypothetical protein niasHT_037670 [Heterodera trifolii]|uniref:Uncharacterized protein n=1 Tax=Heterodera trifolii TaxID=157864 RepID=A0ABD2IND7_9BILA